MRLVLRFDFDGQVSAALLKELWIINETFLAHPKDLQDGKVPITENDVLVNVPYVEECSLRFGHHSREDERLNLVGKYKGCSRPAPSAEMVVYEYYGSDEKLGKFKEMMDAVDKANSAQFSKDDILNPQGWELLSFICDPRTVLGYHRSYKISNKQLMRGACGSLKNQEYR